jgi:hypothetical protein
MATTTSWRQLRVKVKVTLRLTVSQSWCRAPSGAHDQIVIKLLLFDSYGLVFVGLSLTRVRVCLLYILLTLDSVVFLGSESIGTRDHILLSQGWDFPFRRLLRLAGSRWRYSNPPLRGWDYNSTATDSVYNLGTDPIENIALPTVLHCGVTCLLPRKRVYRSITAQRPSFPTPLFQLLSCHVTIYTICFYIKETDNFAHRV